MWRCICALLVFTSQINEKWLNNCYLFLLVLSVKRTSCVVDKPSNSTQSYLGLSVKRKGYVLDKPSNSTQSYLGLSVKRKGYVLDKPSNSTQFYLVCLSNERAACSINRATPPNHIWFCHPHSSLCQCFPIYIPQLCNTQYLIYWH